MTSNRSDTGADFSLLPFPYPYKSALAISSDIDDCTPELFEKIHTFLNTEESTSLGKGLGLEVSDSIWIWSHDDRLVSLLDNNDKPKSYGKKIAELCHAGWIDAFHSIGDYNSRAGFCRNRGKLAYDTLLDMGIKLDTFINHGNRNNIQNFSCRLADSYIGDTPGGDAYHSDLAINYGIKYYWWDELVNTPLSATSPSLASNLNLLFNHSLKNSIKSLIGKGENIRSRQSLTDLLVPFTLKDGNSLWAFTRYNSSPGDVWARPGRNNFKFQLSEKFLNKLVDEQGYAVLYTHFGQPEFASGQALFDQENLEALLRLKASSDNKDILVAATGRLLNYWVNNHFLKWQVSDLEGRKTLNILGIDDPVHGFKEISKNDLEGLAFRLGPDVEFRVELNSKPYDDYNIHKFAEYQIIDFPWKKLELPENGFRLLEQ